MQEKLIVYEILEENNVSTMALKYGGIAEAITKMSFGNKIGAKIDFDEKELFKFNYGAIIVEETKELNCVNAVLLGETISEEEIHVNGVKISLDELAEKWSS